MALPVSLLFLWLSTLHWGQPSFLWTWKLSIATSQLGHWFAAGPLAIALFTVWKRRWNKRALVTLLFNVASFVSFLLPLVSAYQVEPIWKAELAKAFGPPPPRDESWISPKVLFFGRSEKPVTFKREIYRADGTKSLHLDYYAPRSKNSGAADSRLSPWVMVVHGGGWDSGDSEQLADLNSYLASLGYGVVSISYRLAPESLWPAAKEDAQTALQFVRANAGSMGLDPERWAILGRSAGGQIAGAVAYSAKPEDRPKALIAFYAPTDMTFGYEVGEEDDILGSRKIIRNYFRGNPYEQQELYRSASLTELISEDSCPTLLMNGQKDTLVWFKHSERLHERLRLKGVKSSALFTKWGPHGFDYFFRGPEAQLSTHAIQYFLSQTLPLD